LQYDNVVKSDLLGECVRSDKGESKFISGIAGRLSKSLKFHRKSLKSF